MKKPKRTILYGAGMLAMAMSLTACQQAENNPKVYGPPDYITPGRGGSSVTRPETNEDVYGPPRERNPETNEDVYGPPPDVDLTGDAPVRATGEDDYFDGEPTEELVLGQGDSLYGVVFTTDTPVTGFRILAIEMKDVSRDGVIEWDYEEEYARDELVPGEALMVYLTFNGTIPNNGISYVDETGETRYFTVTLSGEDGSVQLDEF